MIPVSILRGLSRRNGRNPSFLSYYDIAVFYLILNWVRFFVFAQHTWIEASRSRGKGRGRKFHFTVLLA
jgi:hypothetical protein